MLTTAPSGLSADENGLEIQSASRIDRRARMIPGAPMRRCAAESVVVLASSVGSTGPDGSHCEKFSQTSLSSEDSINYWRKMVDENIQRSIAYHHYYCECVPKKENDSYTVLKLATNESYLYNKELPD